MSEASPADKHARCGRPWGEHVTLLFEGWLLAPVCSDEVERCIAEGAERPPSQDSVR